MLLVRVSHVVARKRILILLVGIVLMYSVLITRLGYIQLYQGNWLSERAEDLWSRDIPFKAKRGRILDRNGNVLAYNISVASVIAIPAQVEDAQATADRLAPVLHMDKEKLVQLLTKRSLMVYLAPEGRRISEEKAKEIRDLQLPGIVIAEDSKRFYPNGSLAAHILGFAGIDNQGLTGLELVYDDALKGTPGAISFYADGKGGSMPGQSTRFLPPTNGMDLVTTLDLTIQNILESEMEQAMLTYNPEEVIGIVASAKTGEILAMASTPTYDPSNYQKYDAQIYNRNLPIWKMYEPGSTFKIITLAAAIEENKVNLTEGRFHDPGFAVVAGARMRCWKPGGHGSQTFLEVVENSCNPGFIELGHRLGKTKLFQYIKDFGFGTKTGIDLRGEATGILFKLDRVGPVELSTTAFGQGVSVTPIQQVMAVAAAVNGGKLYTPFLAKQWIDPQSGSVINEIKPTVKRTVISESTSKQVREALESVVAKGTGYRAYIEGYRMGGKTGTAQKVGPTGHYLANNHIVSFIGIAPADDPELVIYIAVDNPKGIQFGGVVSAPIVKNVMEQALQYMSIPPRQNGIPKEIRYGDPIQFETVPNLLGMSITQIRNAHYGIALDVSGEGKQVVFQSPVAGTRIREGSKIRIYLGDASSRME